MEKERLFQLSREMENEVLRLQEKEQKEGDTEWQEIVEKLYRLAYENCELVQE